MVIAVSYHDTVTKLQGLAVSAQGPFDRAEWFGLLAKHGQLPVVVVAEGGDAQAAMVLTRGDNGLESLRNWFSFTWRPLAQDGPEVDALLQAIAQGLRKSTHRLLLQPMPNEDGSASRLADAMRKSGWIVDKAAIDENHILPVNGRSFAEYWATRPGKMRTTLQRKAKKVSIEIATRFDLHYGQNISLFMRKAGNLSRSAPICSKPSPEKRVRPDGCVWVSHGLTARQWRRNSGPWRTARPISISWPI